MEPSFSLAALLTGMIPENEAVAVDSTDTAVRELLQEQLQSGDLRMVDYAEAATIISYDMPKLRRKVDPTPIIERFLQSGARRMFLFVLPFILESTTSRAAVAFRKFILDIDLNLVDLSISLPQTVLPSMNLRTVPLLVLDKQRKPQKTGYSRTNVMFINATNLDAGAISDLYTARNFPGLRSAVHEALFQNASSTEEDDFRNLLCRNSSLYASSYCMSEEDQATNAFFEGIETNSLALYANIIGPMIHVKNVDGTLDGQEGYGKFNVLGVNDFSELGYTLPTTGEQKWFKKKKKWEDMLLQPNDIVLTFHGKVGNMTMIDPSFTDRTWLLNQYSCIIRTKKGGARQCDPRVLYMYLQSEIARNYLQVITNTDGPLPRLLISSLKEMPVPAEHTYACPEVISSFEEYMHTARQIAALRGYCNEICQRYWRMPVPAQTTPDVMQQDMI